MAELFTNLLRQEGIWSSSREEYASEKMSRLAKLLQMYSPNYYLIYKPQGVKTDTGIATHAIVEHHPGGNPYVIRWITDAALADPQAIVDWVAAGDLNRHNPKEILARIEAEEDLAKYEQKRIRAEKMAQEEDVAAAVLSGGRNHLHTFKHDGVKYESNTL